MTKNHLKTLAAPKSWILGRKAKKFVTRPNPSGHSKSFCMPATMVLQDQIPLAQTKRELRKLLHNNEIQVDRRRIRDVRFPIGYLDIVSIPSNKKQYRVVLNEKGKLCTIEIDAKEALKPLQIIRKTTLKENKIQLNCNDGRNILVDKDSYKLGDTILFDLEKKKITNTFHLEKGAFIQLSGGKHKGKTGVVDEIKADLVTFSSGKEAIVTLKKYAFVMGKGKSAVKIQ